MQITDKFEIVPVAEITPDARNARKHSDEQIKELRRSLREFGFVNPLLIDKDKKVIAGHGRLTAAIAEGMTAVPCVYVEHLTEAQRRAYMLADNRLAEHATWDNALLSEELKFLDDLGFDVTLTGFDLPEMEQEAVDDGYEPELPKVAKSKVGQVYRLGRHRLLCGDSTDPDHVALLMDGAQADMLLTDPPYNVDYKGKTKDELTIENDSQSDDAFHDFLVKAFANAQEHMKPGAVFYVWHADSNGYIFRSAVQEAGLTVRQCLIWVKNSMVMGRQDYQWRHEPCQPAGTMVRTPEGDVPIETLKDGDRVVSFDTYSGCLKGLRDGLPIKVSSREYEGNLFSVTAAGKTTRTTDNHLFSVRFNPACERKYCTYLMQRGNRFRVGHTVAYDARQFGLKTRMHMEKAEKGWLIETFDTAVEAQLGEQYIACRFGIPYTCWETDRGFQTSTAQRTTEQVDRLYERFSEQELLENANRLLAAYGRSYEYPLIQSDSQHERFSRRVTAKVRACNLMAGIMQVPVAFEGYVGDETFRWVDIDDVQFSPFKGTVYSMDVSRYAHYIADGIVVHNCLYGWKDGAGHLWASDRKQTTVLEFDRPTRSKEHPTMKPIPLFDYQMQNNTKGGDIVLDLFGGSGTSIIAAEQNGRTCYMAEYDPRYVDVIIDRWEKFTGETAVLVRDAE